MAHNVFISFSSKNIETALRIYDGLTNREVKCWISSKHVSPGGNFMNEIVNALSSSSVMVLIYSHDANLSKEIERELALAGQHQLTVIPLKIDDVVPSGAFVYSLATSQWIEVFPNIENTLDTVATTIKAITDRTEKFALEVQKALEEDGVIEPADQKYLADEFGVRMGLTAAQSRAIIKRVIGDSARATGQDRESDYLKLIGEVLEDGKITSLEKRRLSDRAKSLRIDDVRAEELLDQERSKKGIADNSRPIAESLLMVEDYIAGCVDDGEKDLNVDDIYNRKGGNDGHSMDRATESNVITDTARGGSDVDFFDSNDETPWEYFQLGKMTAGQVLDSPEREDLAGYIAFYAIEDEEDISNVLEQLKKASPRALVKDVVENYARFLNADAVGEFSVSNARNWSLGRVIKNLIKVLSLDEVQHVLDETHGKTKVWRAFVETWPDSSINEDLEDEDEDEDDLDTDYHSLGKMKSTDVLEHERSSELIEYIVMFSGETKKKVKKYLNNAEPGQQVIDAVKGLKEFTNLSNLSGYNVKFAKDFELARVIADALEFTDTATIEAVLASTNGNTLLKNALSEYWPK